MFIRFTPSLSCLAKTEFEINTTPGVSKTNFWKENEKNF